MIHLLQNKTFDKYRTIWSSDYKKFAEVSSNPYIFNQYGFFETRWNIVHNPSEVKAILDNKFISKGREEEYEVNIPSVTQITGTLSPVNLNSELYKLFWLNNEKEEIILAKEQENLISLEMGSYIHKIIENWIICDIKNKKLEDIIEFTRTDISIQRKIVNWEEKQIKYESIARNMLPDFIDSYLSKFDIIGSEIFLNCGLIQGSIDLIAVRKGEYYIIDFKTTRKTYKNGSRKFSTPNDMIDYHKQMCLYDKMLKQHKVIPKNYETKFKIFQFHLLAEEFKEFNVEYSEINKWNEVNKKVLGWYWDVRNGKA